MMGRFRVMPARGGLIFIIACLVISALLRLADPEIALAKGVTELAHFGGAEEISKVEDVSGSCVREADPEEMLQAIKDRQSQLELREARLADRMQALKIAELKLSENTRVLIEVENRLAATLALADSAAEKDLLRLTALYESMKPKNASGVFQAMAPEFAAGFLARMRPEAAAEIMSLLPADKAYTISLILAGRNAAAPKN